MNNIYNRYIWLLHTVYQERKVTFERLCEIWKHHFLYNGKPLSLRTFHHHRNMIEENFDIVIECNRKDYTYYIQNLDEILGDSCRNWLFNRRIIDVALKSSPCLFHRIVLPDMSCGIEYLPNISECIIEGHELYIFYTNDKGNEVECRVQPEGLKLFHNRWYLFGYRNGSKFCAVPLDLLKNIYLSGNSFQTDYKFSLAERISDSIGVVVLSSQQPETVSLKAYGSYADYLRKYPFHHSQVERNDMGTFTTFDYRLLVTDELVDEILALGDKMEIVYPEKLRMKLHQKIGLQAFFKSRNPPYLNLLIITRRHQRMTLQKLHLESNLR